MEFDLYVIPVAKGRARTARGRNGAISHYTPATTRAFESQIAARSAIAMTGRAIIEGPVHLEIAFEFEPPKSWSKAKKKMARSGGIHHIVKPDLSNLQKSIEDAMNKIVYQDDSQIVSASTIKRYGHKPKISVKVRTL